MKMTWTPLGTLLVSTLVFAALAPGATAHGPGARYTATGTATLFGQALDATLIFSGNQDGDGVGSAYVELRDPATGTPVHMNQFEARENALSVRLEGCWFVVEPYGLVEKNVGAAVIDLGGIKRICADNGMQDNAFTGRYLSSFVLRLTAVGIF